MRVLVTGGAGFIGGWVCSELSNQGHAVRTMDICNDPGQDVRDPEAVAAHLYHADAVIHLAAILGTQETVDDPIPVAETNLIGSLNVFEEAVVQDKPVVYIAVGNAWMREIGTGAYTITKTAVEDFVRMYNQWRGGTISVVRPVNAYGPGQSVHTMFGGPSGVRKIIPTFIHQALLGTPIEVYGNGTQVSDCVWVGDVARALVKAIGRTGTYSVGPKKSHNVAAIAAMVQQEVENQTGRTSPITYLPMRIGETPGVTAAREKPILPRSSLKPLAEGLRQTVAWYIEKWSCGR